MQNYFVSKGSVDTICEDIIKNTGFNRENAKAIFDYLVKNKEKLHLADDEKITSSFEFPSFSPGTIGFMTPKYNYSINIKKTTIIIVALILDIAFTKGIISTLLNMFGLSGICITKLSEANGEKCIVKETVFSENKTGNADILNAFDGECCNCDMNCNYRRGDRCTCSRDNIIDIYQRLTEVGLFRKEGDSFVYQQ